MREPTCQVPIVVHARVSAEASAANQSGPSSTAVRQQPEHAMDAPRAMEAVSGHGASITRRMSRPSPIGLIARTVPSAVIMPVNISLALCIR